MGVKVEIDVNKVVDRLGKRIDKAQTALDLQVIKDSNVFCPEDVGTLQNSAITNSEIGKGKVVWDTEYARMQYYTDNNKSTDKNPNASMKWFEAAKARFKQDWTTLTNKIYDRG